MTTAGPPTVVEKFITAVIHALKDTPYHVAPEVKSTHDVITLRIWDPKQSRASLDFSVSRLELHQSFDIAMLAAMRSKDAARTLDRELAAS